MATTLNPYLNFDGNCAEAMAFYAEVLGGKLEVMRMGDSPMPVPPEAKNRVMHASLITDTLTIMASDTQVGEAAVRGNQVHLSLTFTSTDEQTRAWDKLAVGGKITMALAEQFWGRFGSVTDRYGISWMLNHQAPKK